MVKSSKSPAERFWDKVDKRGENECWEWTGCKFTNGHGQFRFNSKLFLVHRLAWSLFNNQEIPEGKIVVRSCDGFLCCNPAHLFLGTRSENMAGMNVNGRLCRGSNKKNAKLNEQSAREVKQMLKDGVPPPAIAEKFNVSRAAIHQVRKEKTWRHI